jgi:hypothetical protein
MTMGSLALSPRQTFDKSSKHDREDMKRRSGQVQSMTTQNSQVRLHERHASKLERSNNHSRAVEHASLNDSASLGHCANTSPNNVR